MQLTSEPQGPEDATELQHCEQAACGQAQHGFRHCLCNLRGTDAIGQWPQSRDQRQARQALHACRKGQGCRRRAAPSTSALARPCPDGSVRSTGCSSEKHSTGAATLVIHMDANVATWRRQAVTGSGLR